jgi:murein DD-endopeptidase MepM/ murein hydrolase activator NlpD
LKEPSARAWVAGVIAATLLLPAVASSAGTKEEKLDDVQAEREEVQEQIDLHEAEAADLRANAKDLNDQIAGLRKDVADLDADIAEISSRVRSVQARIDDTQAEIDAIQDMATSQAVALYKSGSGESLEALLDSSSLSELDNKIELMGVAAQENTTSLIRYGRLRVTIEDQHRELFAVQEELETTRKEQVGVLADLDDKHAQLAANLAELERRLDKEHAHEEILAKQETALERDILAASAGRAVAAKGVSTAGYIWPLGGAITSYYGPRWGRMHTGIDIDGTSGQPIVASKAGRVIVASYYGGYGNAVVVDHGGGVTTLYGHMSAFNVSNGQSVSQGAVLGYVGCTGSCTGDHLHFEVRVNGSPQDPLNYLP